ncbi:MAG: 30S ribosomal protein S16 [Desulfobacterales bacterium]|nr:30S ribosomal protein S16 [Desulfobacterales bacterium]
MAVRMRLARHGTTKRPFYWIVVADNERYLENVGTYDPAQDPAQVTLKTDRVLYWLQQGAIPTDTVRSLLKKQGVGAHAAQAAQPAQ